MLDGSVHAEAGEVVEVNAALGSQSELINSDPYTEGWLLKVRLTGDKINQKIWYRQTEASDLT